jgi:hypothetical protein
MMAMIKMLSWFALGVLVGYVIQLKRNIQLHEKLEAATKFPLKPTREDWWENNKPDTDDEYTLTKARHDWLQGFLSNMFTPMFTIQQARF